MKGKKWLTIITFFCFVAALLIAVLIGKASISVGYDIAMAVFGSALLGFIISLIEYFFERRTAMEVFWQEARKALAQLRKIIHIDIDAPMDLVLQCFKEELANKFVLDLGDSAELANLHIKHIAANNLMSWFEENITLAFSDNDDIDVELQKIYKHQMQVCRNEVRRCIDSCFTYEQIDLGPLDNAYGNLDYIFANNMIRKSAYHNIFNKIRVFRRLVLEEIIHFKLLIEGKGNFAVCAEKANNISSKIFDVNEQECDGYISKVVYQSSFDDIDEALELFRCKIYWNQKPELPERIPVSGTTRLVSFEKESE